MSNGTDFQSETGNNVSIKSIADFIRDHKTDLVIPDLQRTYVWNQDQWGQLWDDVITVFQKTRTVSDSGKEKDPYPQHFFGAITLSCSQKAGKLEILDGQQRLTTLIILLRYLRSEQVDDHKCGDEETFIDNLFNKTANVDFSAEENGKPLKGNSIFIQALNFFSDSFLRLGKPDIAADLEDVILHRFFVMEKITTDDAHDVFEGLNATGSNLSFADLIMNYILEENASDLEENASKKLRSEKDKWQKILNSIYDGKAIQDPVPEDLENLKDDVSLDADNETDEIKVHERPLKLKKFLNALYSTGRINSASVPETVDGFLSAVQSVIHYENDIHPANPGTSEELTPENIYKVIEEWSVYYIAATDPVNLPDANCFLDKSFSDTLYYFSLITESVYVPMTMRLLYLFDHKKVKEEEVKAVLSAMVVYCIYKAVYAPRDNSDIFQIKRRAVVFDYILLAWKHSRNAYTKDHPDESVSSEMTTPEACVLLLGNGEMYEKVRGCFNYDMKRSEYPLESANSVLNFQYISGMSKLLLCIDHDLSLDHNPQGEKVKLSDYIFSLERSIFKNKQTRFQVEHVIAQNLEETDDADKNDTDSGNSEGTIGNYGFSVGEIGKPINLVLLEADINNHIKAGKPEIKINGKPEDAGKQCSKWTDSGLYEYYKDGVYSYFDPSANNDGQQRPDNKFYEFLKTRALKLCKNIGTFGYEVLTDPNCQSPKEIRSHGLNALPEKLYFQKENRILGRTVSICQWFSDPDEDKDKPSSEHIYYYLDFKQKKGNKAENGNVTTNPPRISDDDEWKGFYYTDTDPSDPDKNKIESKSGKDDSDTGLTECIKTFVKCWAGCCPNGKSDVYSWLRNKEKPGEENSCPGYNMKIIHTSDLTNALYEKYCKDNTASPAARKEKGMTADALVKKYNGKYTIEVPFDLEDKGKNGKKYIVISADFNGRQAADDLSSIYNLISSENKKIQFGFWLEVSKPKFQAIGINNNYEIGRLPYINVGDRATYLKWIADNIANGKKAAVPTDSPSDEKNSGSGSAEVSEIGMSELAKDNYYFDAKNKSFLELFKSDKEWQIPVFQRDYVWEERHWKDLWDRICHHSSKKPLTLGTIIFNIDGQGNYSIVDGQQRLTTLCILYSVLQARSTPQEGRRKQAQLSDEMANHECHESHGVSNMLKLLFPYATSASEGTEQGNNHQQKCKCEKFFEEIFNKGNADQQDQHIEDINDLVQQTGNISFDCVLIKAQGTKGRLYQYAVFSSVNGKGVKLTLEEKVKNLLFRQFENIENQPAKKESVKKIIEAISATDGYITAYAESKKGEHIAESDLYDTYKELLEKNSMDREKQFSYIKKNWEIFCAIKGIKIRNGAAKEQRFSFSAIDSSLQDPEKTKDLRMWLLFYRVLQVTTADNVLLYYFDQFYNKERTEKESSNKVELSPDNKKREDSKKIDHLTDLLHRIVLLYFLLYVMDRSGNDKKSVNSKIPLIIKAFPDGMKGFGDLRTSFSIREEKSDCRNKKITILSESGNLSGDSIFSSFIQTLPLGSMMVRTVPRFILLMIERWLGLEQDILIDILEHNEDYDVEHICPASDDNTSKIKPVNSSDNVNSSDEPLSGSFINQFPNICLLEHKINISCGNKLMVDERKNGGGGKLFVLDNGKITLEQKDPVHPEKGSTYYSSRMIMPRMFYNQKTFSGGTRLPLNEKLVTDCSNGEKKIYAYFTKNAENRMNMFREMIINNPDSLYMNDIRLITGTSENRHFTGYSSADAICFK